MTAFGIDNLLRDRNRLAYLADKKVGLVAHPASITASHQHTIDALVAAGVPVCRAFGPQHGMRGDKQDNMIESPDYVDPRHDLPVFSLYGEHRAPTDEMLAGLDVILFDLQDVGCRIYTYITTMRYFMAACEKNGVAFWVLDRPNPSGRSIDGLYLTPGEESFVGCAAMPTRHGLTVGELANWFGTDFPALSLTVIPVSDYRVEDGWPTGIRPWVNPSPNAASVNMTRCFPGTVLLEGTTLSEGRGTTVPLEVIGAPDLDFEALLTELARRAPALVAAAFIRPCWFEPTFHKHVGSLCSGLQFHTDVHDFDEADFKPYRLIAFLLKLVREQSPDYDLWRHHDYEYELDRIPIDVINGGPALRTWVDDASVGFEELSQQLDADETRWQIEREPFLIYR